MIETRIEQTYAEAVERYGELGVKVEEVLAALSKVRLSLHCWQGDDVGGFETKNGDLSGSGLAVTGFFPGKARSLDELRADLDAALAVIPGKHRVNLHAMYGDFGGRTVERDEIDAAHFASWIDWARERGLGLDFNATCFGHPKADQGTLTHPNPDARAFWVRHVQACRSISEAFGKELGTPCLHNLWIPDGEKDVPASRLARRERLLASLDEIYAQRFKPEWMKDSVECKLFGIGSEAFVAGSHEFYLCWALKNRTLLCLDMGHFHPTESVADKLSALLPFFPELLVHVSRGLRWDSDHVVIQNEELSDLMLEIVRSDTLNRVHLALDYFDASLNRVGAWAVGTRAALRTLLFALLEPKERITRHENEGDLFARLAWREEAKALPFGAVWNMHCLRQGAPVGGEWIEMVQAYGCKVARERG